MRRLLTWPNAIVVLGMAVVLILPPLGMVLVAAGIWLHYLRNQHEGKQP